MVMSDRLYTRDDFRAYCAQHPDARVELIDGRIVEKVTSEQHGKIAGWLLHLLIVYLNAHPDIKGHWSTEATFAPDNAPANARRPDVAFRRTEDAVSDDPVITGMPDFIVEIKSPGNTYDDQRAKARFYIEHGARLVWLIFPVPRLVEIYAADGTNTVYKEGQTLDGGQALPGFRVAVEDVFNV